MLAIANAFRGAPVISGGGPIVVFVRGRCGWLSNRGGRGWPPTGGSPECAGTGQDVDGRTAYELPLADGNRPPGMSPHEPADRSGAPPAWHGCHGATGVQACLGRGKGHRDPIL